MALSKVIQWFTTWAGCCINGKVLKARLTWVNEKEGFEGDVERTEFSLLPDLEDSLLNQLNLGIFAFPRDLTTRARTNTPTAIGNFCGFSHQSDASTIISHLLARLLTCFFKSLLLTS